MKKWLLSLAKPLIDRPAEHQRGSAWKAFYLLTLLSDLAMILLGLLAAAGLRELLRQSGYTRSPEIDFVFINFPAILIYYWASLIIAFKYVDVYRERRFLTGNREQGRIAKGVFAFTLVNAVLAYFLSSLFLPSSLTLGFSFVFVTCFVLLGRHLIQRLREALRRRELDIQVAVIIGTGAVARELASELIETVHHGYRLIGFVDESGKKQRIDGIKVFGGLDHLERIVRRLKVDEVFICEPDWHAPLIMSVFSTLRPLGIKIRVVSSIFNVAIERVGVPIDEIAGTPILDFGSGRSPTWRLAAKRLIDIAGAVAVFTLLSPIWILISMAIKFGSRGPILYSQKRVGQDGHEFLFYKFRSMVTDADELLKDLEGENEISGPMFKIKEDPRVTSIGRFLRKYSLDELPQFWNILRGEMSLVGPRPPLPDEVEKYETWHRKRLTGPMGLTGLWQVSGRNDLDFDDMAMLDIYYIRNYSLFMDYRIMIRTLFTVLLAQGR